MSLPSEILRQALEDAKNTIASVAKLEASIVAASERITACLTSGSEGKIPCLWQWRQRGRRGRFLHRVRLSPFQEDRQPFPALNLSQGGSLLTATANDYGFDEIFSPPGSRHLDNRAGDVLIAISTSGKSANNPVARSKKRKIRGA